MSNAILNQLSLVPRGKYSDLGYTFEMFVDQQAFLTKVSEFESRYSHSINGSYIPGLSETDLTKNRLGEPHTIVPYVCECGDWQCWFLTAEVSFYDNFVYWGNWCNPFRGDKSKQVDGRYWSYREFPTLVFDRQQYLTEIEKAILSCHENT